MKMLQTIELTDNQKRVMAKIIQAPTPRVASEDVIGSKNLVAARDILQRLGLVTFIQGELSLSDKGREVARQENIADESGALTPDGEKLAYTNTDGSPTSNQQQGGDQAGGAQPPATGAPAGGDELFMSHHTTTGSLSLLRELFNR